MKRRRIATCTDSAGEVHTLRERAGGAELSAADRLALLADVRGNPASTAKLTIDATTYIQGETPNRNFVRFRAGKLKAIAKSFAGAPFLRDHNKGELLARGGTILESELIETADGSKAFLQTIELVKPWAIEAALDGTLDRFSIGWRALGDVTCTVCSAAYESSWFGLAPTCEHEPGVEYEVRSGTRIAEAEFAGAEGVEVSGVSVPAVPNTSIDEIRAALAAGELPGFSQKEIVSMLPNITKALRLAADADESTVLAEIERRDMLLDAERRARTEAEARLAAMQEAASEKRRADLIATALREGKLRPGSELQTKLAALALANIDAAEALVAELPRVTPVGAGLVSAQTEPPAVDGGALSESDREVCRQLKLAPADFLKTKAPKFVNGRV